MKFVYHVNNEPAVMLIDGHLITVNPREVTEVKEIVGMDCNNNGPVEYRIPDHKVLGLMLEHAWYHGLVEVPVIRKGNDFTTDVEGAAERAADALQIAEDKMLTQYVTEQQERVSRHNKSAIAPNGRVLKIINKRGIDIKKEFNIDAPGYTIDKAADRDKQIQELQAQVEKLMAALGESKPSKK